MILNLLRKRVDNSWSSLSLFVLKVWLGNLGSTVLDRTYFSHSCIFIDRDYIHKTFVCEFFTHTRKTNQSNFNFIAYIKDLSGVNYIIDSLLLNVQRAVRFSTIFKTRTIIYEWGKGWVNQGQWLLTATVWRVGKGRKINSFEGVQYSYSFSKSCQL